MKKTKRKQPTKRTKPKPKKVTYQQVEAWLGTSSPYTEAIAIITDVCNGDYKPAMLRSDITDYEF